jgi:hypothetical protein
VSGFDGVEALVLALADSLAREWDRIPEAAIVAADALVRLVAVACGAFRSLNRGRFDTRACSRGANIATRSRAAR